MCSFLGLLLVPGLIMCANEAVFQSNSAAATATIVGYHTYHDAGKGSCPAHISYNVTASFTTTGGDTVTDVIGNIHYCAPLANGFTVPIRYDINDPSQAQSADGADNWGSPILVLGLGALCVVGVCSSSSSSSSSSQWGKWRGSAWRAAHPGPKR